MVKVAGLDQLRLDGVEKTRFGLHVVTVSDDEIAQRLEEAIALAAQQVCQIGCGLEMPGLAALDEFDTATVIMFGKLRQRRRNVNAVADISPDLL